jgi:hypothetical protein
MTQLEIFNLALSLHDRAITQEDLDSLNPSKEVRLCKTYQPVALIKALRELDWSFFTQKLTIDLSDDVPGWGYLHGFPLPENLFKHVPINDDPFQIAGGRYYTDTSDPILYGMFKACFDTMEHPDEFDMLVAYAISYEICGILSPKSGIDQQAVQQYSWILGALTAAEVHNNYRADTRG